MPVETKSSPIFSIGPFVPSSGHLPLWSTASGNGILDHAPGRSSNSSSSSSDGSSSRGESPDLPREDGPRQESGAKPSVSSLPPSTCSEPVQPPPPAAAPVPPPTTSEVKDLSVGNPGETAAGEKPALPPRPSHLSTSSNHRRRPSGHQLSSTPRSSRATPGTPTSPNLTSSPVLTEKEYIERIAKQQMDTLIPLKEDVSDWLNRILKVPDITVDNFMGRLDNGVIVCKLAKLIEMECNLVLPNGSLAAAGAAKTGTAAALNGSQTPPRTESHTTTPTWSTPGKSIQEIPKHFYVSASHRGNRISSVDSASGSPFAAGGSVPFTAATMKCWENAKSRTFFARDNVSNFLNWCRLLGVHDAVLFETEDLVSHVNQRHVVLCLLEVARIACTRHSFSPAPGLVEFEQEIDREIERELKREEEKQKMKELKANKTTAAEVLHPKKPAHLKSSDLQQATPKDVLLAESLSAGKIDEALPEVDQGVQLEDLEEEDEVTLHSSRPLSSNADEIDRGSSLMDEETSATESEEHQCNNTVSSPEIRSPSPANSIISSASSTYLEPNMVSCGGSSVSDAASHSSTPTPMTSELDHKVMLIAKTYYGKEARQGVQRLSEGKYKIANRIVFVRLLKARHVMVRVGGGWTTLSDFLIRHGGDPDHQILPDELLPLDTKPSSSHPRRRSSSTHTLVIPGNVLGASSASSHYHSKTPTPTPDLTALHNSRGSVTPTTASYHPSSRYINSTPVSRRSSISSPEPSIGSSTSGYSSSGNSSFAKNAQGHTPNADTKIPVLRRRQRLPSLQLNHDPFRYRSNSSLSISSLPRSTSTILSGPGSGELSYSNSSIPRSNTTLSGRYINYLQSSQHITRRQSSNSNIPLNVTASGSTTPVNGTNGSATSPSLTTPPKQAAFSAVRKTAQKTF